MNYSRFRLGAQVLLFVAFAVTASSTKAEMEANGSPKIMTEAEIVAQIAESCNVNKEVAKRMLDTLVDLAIKETKTKGSFSLPGIGKLRKVHRRARMGRNPQTGQPIKIPAKTVVRFRVAKTFKDAVLSTATRTATP